MLHRIKPAKQERKNYITRLPRQTQLHITLHRQVSSITPYAPIHTYNTSGLVMCASYIVCIQAASRNSKQCGSSRKWLNQHKRLSPIILLFRNRSNSWFLSPVGSVSHDKISTRLPPDKCHLYCKRVHAFKKLSTFSSAKYWFLYPQDQCNGMPIKALKSIK